MLSKAGVNGFCLQVCVVAGIATFSVVFLLLAAIELVADLGVTLGLFELHKVEPVASMRRSNH